MVSDEQDPRGHRPAVRPAARAEDSVVGCEVAGRYRVLGRIGAGGMGVVYEAEHIALAKRVALKILRNELSHSPEIVERFKREARAMSAIGHPNIVDVSDFGELPDGSLFFTMELLRGESLATLLQRERRVTVERALEILEPLCGAIQAAHAVGVLHRDLKPENVFLARDRNNRETVKVLDFGVAKTAGSDNRLTQAGTVMGTPLYLAPETVLGRPVDARCDVYSAGIMAFELITGRVPFDAENFVAVLHQHVHLVARPPSEACPPAGIPPAVDAVVLRALAKDPDQRFASMRDFSRAFRVAVRGPNDPGLEDARPQDLRRTANLPRPQPRTATAAPAASTPPAGDVATVPTVIRQRPADRPPPSAPASALPATPPPDRPAPSSAAAGPRPPARSAPPAAATAPREPLRPSAAPRTTTSPPPSPSTIPPGTQPRLRATGPSGAGLMDRIRREMERFPVHPAAPFPLAPPETGATPPDGARSAGSRPPPSPDEEDVGLEDEVTSGGPGGKPPPRTPG